MARPSTYDETKDYQKLAEDYLQTCGREQTKLPKISEFCREYIGADEDTVTLWLKGERLPEGANTVALSVAIKRVKDAQKEQLMDDGLYGGKEINNAMAIFLLKANHNLIETERREWVGKDGEQPVFKLVIEDGYGNQFKSVSKLPTQTGGSDKDAL